MSTILLLSFNLSVNKIIKGLGKKLTETNTSRIKLINETFRAFDVIKLFNKTQYSNFNLKK